MCECLQACIINNPLGRSMGPCLFIYSVFGGHVGRQQGLCPLCWCCAHRARAVPAVPARSRSCAITSDLRAFTAHLHPARGAHGEPCHPAASTAAPSASRPSWYPTAATVLSWGDECIPGCERWVGKGKGEKRGVSGGLRELVHRGVHGFGWMSGCGVVCLGVGVPWQ